MKKLGTLAIIFLLSTSLAAAISPVKMFKIEASFTETGEASIEDINITETRRTSSSLYKTNNNFSLKLKTENTTVKEGPIPLSFSSPIDTFNSTERRARKDNVTKVLLFGYRKSIEQIEILNNDEVVAFQSFTDILCKNDNVCTSYCDGKKAEIDCTCGDGICQEGLNERQFCQRDCESPEEDEEAPGDTSSPNGEEVVNESYGIYILAGIAVIATLILLFMASGKVKIEG